MDRILLGGHCCFGSFQSCSISSHKALCHSFIFDKYS